MKLSHAYWLGFITAGLLFAFLLTGCGGNGDEEAPPPEEGRGTTQPVDCKLTPWLCT